jgi:hypothetical protein
MINDYTFKNKSSIQNIPAEVQGILKDTVALYTGVIPKEVLVCIFAKGSIPRGNFKPGVSDFDTDAIVSRELTEEEKTILKKRRHLLEKLYQKRGVAKIDIGFVNLKCLLAGEKPELHFILSTDGVCLYGEAPTLRKTWPHPGNELSKMLNQGFPKKIEMYRSHLNGGGIARAGLNVEQWFAKEGVRLLFGITMEQSGCYTARLEDYRNAVQTYLNAELARFDRLYSVYLGGGIQESRLLKDCEHILELAKTRDAI